MNVTSSGTKDYNIPARQRLAQLRLSELRLSGNELRVGVEYL